MKDITNIATLAGGCFWCLEAVYENVIGVTAVESGYSGGSQADPSYESVTGGQVVMLKLSKSLLIQRQSLIRICSQYSLLSMIPPR